MKNAIEITEDVLIVMGVTISLDNIESLLGIIILGFQIALILFKGGRLIYNKVKNKDYTGAIDTAKDTAEKINEVVKKNGDRKDTK